MTAIWPRIKNWGLILCDADQRENGRQSLPVWVLSSALALFLGLVLCSPGRLLYDEPWYLATVELAKQHGPFSGEFMVRLPGPAGPLYTWYHLLLAPLTGLTPVGVRLATAVALGLAVGVACTVSVVPREQRTILFLIGVTCQFAWILGGMALTEAPAMLCAAIAVRLWDLSLQPALLFSRLLLAGGAGIALGLAVLGRQPYALVGLAIGLISLKSWPRLGNAVVMGLLCVAVLLPVLWVWQGVVPPLTAFVAGGFHSQSLVLACGYAGIFFLAAAPRFLLLRVSVLLPALALAIANGAFGPIRFLPMVSVARKLGNASFVEILSRVFGAILVAAAVVVVASCVVRIWQMRSSLVGSTAVLSVLLILIGCGFIGHQFSSRYVGAALPFFLVMIAAYVKPAVGLAVRTSCTAAIGLLSLASYYEFL